MSPSFQPAAGSGRPDVAGLVARGIDFCRQDDWERGLAILGHLAQAAEKSALSGLFYSYLGYGIARCERRVEEGKKLCQHAIRIEFYQPENYFNLARTQLLGNDRRGAVSAIFKGLKIDPNSLELLTLQRELGVRRGPVIPFLSRDNPLNRLLGRLRHAVSGR